MKVLFDIFPARVRVVPAGDVSRALAASELNTYTVEFGRAVDRVRVVLTDDRLLIAADSDTGPVLIFREHYDQDSLYWPKSNSEQKSVISVSGKLILVQHDPNCGCGSRLRSWNPYRTIMSEQDPAS